jgi:hypothetical protein
MAANREAIKAANPGAAVTDIAKLSGVAWAKCQGAERAKFEAMAAKDKARYESEKAKA